jgi:hypothetical protein
MAHEEALRLGPLGCEIGMGIIGEIYVLRTDDWAVERLTSMR